MAAVTAAHRRPIGPLSASRRPYQARPAGHSAGKVSPEVYRRRRLVAAAIVAGVLLAGLWSMGLLGRAPLSAAEQARRPIDGSRLELVDQRTYVVQPGDTLWSIARRAQPSGDIRPLVDRLAAQTAGRPLQVGDRVTLP